MSVNIGHLIVLEYSPIQKAFHRSTVEELIANNLTTIVRGIDNGYKVIGIFHDHAACDHAHATILPVIEKIEKKETVETGHFTFQDLIKMVNS